MSPPRIGGHGPLGPDDKREHDAYVERVVRECMARTAEVARVIGPEARQLGITEDIVAEAIEKTVEYADRHGLAKEIKSVIAFLITTARHLLANVIRGAKPGELDPVSLDDKASAHVLNEVLDSSATDILARLELKQRLEIALGKLLDVDRQVFRMQVEHGMTTEEIAATMKVTPTMIRLRLRRCKAVMREVMTKNVT